MITLLIIISLAALAFYGYFAIRRTQVILDDSITPTDQLFEKTELTPKQYGIRFCNGKSRVKKSNRLRYSK